MLRQYFTQNAVFLAPGATQTVGWGSFQGSMMQDQCYLLTSGISDQPGLLTINESDDTKTPSMTRIVMQVPITAGVRFNFQATIRCINWQVTFLNQGGATQQTFSFAVDTTQNLPANFDASGNLLVNIAGAAGGAVPSSTVDPNFAGAQVPFTQWMQIELEMLIELRKVNMMLAWLKDPQQAAVPVELTEPNSSFSRA